MSTNETLKEPKTFTLDGAFLKQQSAEAVRTFTAPLRWPAKLYRNARVSIENLVNGELEKRRIATMVVNKVKFVGSKSIDDLPNDKWFVQKGIAEYKNNPKFKAGADAVMKPIKTAALLVGMVMTGATVALFAGPTLAFAATVGTVSMAVGALINAPGLKQDFDQASTYFKEKTLPPFMLKTGISVFRYSSKEKAHDVADDIKNAGKKITGLFKKKSNKADKKAENKKPAPKGPKPPSR